MRDIYRGGIGGEEREREGRGRVRKRKGECGGDK